MSKNSGYLVETKHGKVGRTKHENGLINGKVPVYLCEVFSTKEIEGSKIPLIFADTAILCDSTTLKHIGFIH